MLKQEYIRALRQNGFPPEIVLISFDAPTIQRGMHYFEAGRVIELQSHFPSLSEVQLQGLVLGSAKYRTQVTLDLNQMRIYSVCTCPVGHQCKHGLAVLLQYVRQQVKTPNKALPAKIVEPSALELWLADLNTPTSDDYRSLPTPETADANERRMDLIYLLEQPVKREPKLALQVRKATRLKRGGYGQGYPVQLEDLLYAWKNHPYFYTEQDEDIAQLILPHTGVYGQQQRLFLKGQLGELTLNLLLQTGRAFWQKAEYSALKTAPARSLQLNWLKEKNNYHIQLQVTPPAQDYFWLDQLYYVDLLRGECGPLQHEPLTTVQVVKLLAAPPIPLAEAGDISRALLELLPDADIPLPDQRLTPDTIDINEPPIPTLRLYTLDAALDPIGQHRLELQFDYAGHLLAPQPDQSLQIKRVGTQRYRIQRQAEFEKQSLAVLTHYGFDAQVAADKSLAEWIIPADSPSLAALRWNHFLAEGLVQLELAGWHIEQADNFSLDFMQADDWEADLKAQGQDWFELSLGFMVDGKRINLLPVLVDMLVQMRDPQELRQMLKTQGSLLVPLDRQRWIKLDAERILQVLDTLIELYDQNALNEEGNLLLSRFHGAGLNELLNDPRLRWKGAEELQQLAMKLASFQGITTVPLPDNLNAHLRPYQHEGLNWLQFLREFQFNGILADDMGLGKTLQTLAHLLVEKQSGRATSPNLVIAPTSLMSNWRREAEKFTPDLKVLTLHGTERHQSFEQLNEYDLILTTYPLILRDEALYRDLSFHYLILDEAQAIKNAKAKTTQVIYELKAAHRLCLTGTPMENHLGEVWSMFHFLMPGFLGTHDRFGRLFRVPIERYNDPDRQRGLRNRLQAFMLRRTKEHVAHELPAKTEIIRTVTLTGKQRDLYETVRLAMDKKVREEISQKGFARSHIMILDALLKLRQVCCDPRLLKLDQARGLQESAKLDLLLEMLDELLAENRKVLLFSQFTSMLNLIEMELQKQNILYSKLTGQTRNREEVIDYFQNGAAQIFLISLKAGGTGLNLTAADTVIHYDPWWNPAVEQQATDRAYRIGQDKPVFVYKLLTEETVEEKILQLQSRKQALADGLYSEMSEQTPSLPFGQNELLDLLKPLDGF